MIGFVGIAAHAMTPAECRSSGRHAERVVAVLVRGAQAGLREQGMSSSADTWAVGVGRAYLWAYLPRGGDGGAVTVGVTSEGRSNTRSFEALRTVGDRQARRMGVTGDAAVVSFVANCGTAPLGGLGVVLERVRVVRSVHADRALADLRETATAWLAANRAEVDAALTTAAAPFGGVPSGPPSVALDPWLWWDDGTLWLSLRLRVSNPGPEAGNANRAVVDVTFDRRVGADGDVVSDEVSELQSRYEWSLQ